MKYSLIIFILILSFSMTLYGQEKVQEKKQSKNQVQDKKEIQSKEQVRVQENKELKEQTKLQQQEQKYIDMDGDGVNDGTAKNLAKDANPNVKSDVGHGEGAGAMKRPRDRDQDGKMQPGSGAGPKGETPRTQKGARKGQD